MHPKGLITKFIAITVQIFGFYIEFLSWSVKFAHNRTWLNTQILLKPTTKSLVNRIQIQSFKAFVVAVLKSKLIQQLFLSLLVLKIFIRFTVYFKKCIL